MEALVRIVACGPPVPRVALTFDDGPSGSTPGVLDVLEAERVPATFFVVGAHVAGREETLRRMLAAGHEVGVHSFTHPNALLVKDTGELRDDYARAVEAVVAATGERPTLVRPPYGGDPGRVARIGLELGLAPTVLWTVLGWDWEDGADAKAIAGHVLANVHPGAIVCLHDGAPRAPDAPDPRAATVAALPLVLDGLRAAGLEPVALRELLDHA